MVTQQQLCDSKCLNELSTLAKYICNSCTRCVVEWDLATLQTSGDYFLLMSVFPQFNITCVLPAVSKKKHCIRLLLPRYLTMNWA